MTKIKLCGLTRSGDIEAANQLLPDYIGFVFAAKSRRAVTAETAAALKALLRPEIRAVGVFVDEQPEAVAALLNNGTIELAQLHGHEDEDYLRRLRALTDRLLIQAFRIASAADLQRAEASSADAVLLDAGAGTGTVFDWTLLRNTSREYFLAGGLNAENVGAAIRTLHPAAVDVSSGIETDGIKDPKKMAAFVKAVREEALL